MLTRAGRTNWPDALREWVLSLGDCVRSWIFNDKGFLWKIDAVIFFNGAVILDAASSPKPWRGGARVGQWEDDTREVSTLPLFMLKCTCRTLVTGSRRQLGQTETNVTDVPVH